MNISSWLKQSTKELKNVGISSARLDAELLLSETIRKPRTYLHAHLDEMIDVRRLDIANARLDLRKDRVPLAYILGHKEFYGRQFIVSPDVLVPRPESEDMISAFLKLSSNEIASKTLLDVGTGSGCLGITIALERPELRVILSDISPKALRIATKNANNLHANVSTLEQSLLVGHFEPLDYIFANLPYVDKDWTTSPELKFEPQQALFAKNKGLEIIYSLIEQAPKHLNPGGLLFLEADPTQHQSIVENATKHGFKHIANYNYIIVLRFISIKN